MLNNFRSNIWAIQILVSFSLSHFIEASDTLFSILDEDQVSIALSFSNSRFCILICSWVGISHAIPQVHAFSSTQLTSISSIFMSSSYLFDINIEFYILVGNFNSFMGIGVCEILWGSKSIPQTLLPC